MKATICWLFGHKWDRDFMDIPPTTVFMRVDCRRCGMAIDGVKAKMVFDRLGWKP